MLTTDPIYWKPLLPKIVIQNLSKGTTYYTYDGLLDSAVVKPVYCRVQLGLDHTGSFEVQFENSGLTLDTANIKAGNRCIISLSKDSTLAYNTLISGLIRKITIDRGIGGQALYTISGSSTAIRLNENVTYYVKEARKLAQDNTTIDITDPAMKADTLLQSVLTTDPAELLVSESSLGIINPNTLVTNSDVENFIASISIQYGQLQDAVNLVEEQTDAECFVDVNDLVQLRHQFQPFTSGRGFILTDTQGAADNADYTCYIEPTSPPSYSESKFVSDGYSSQLVGILPADNPPSKMEDLGWRDPPTSLNILNTVEYAQKFRPTHNHWFPGDLFIVGSQSQVTTTGGSNWNQWFRICRDSGGLPLNVGGIVFNIMFRYRVWPDTIQTTTTSNPDVYRLTNDQLFYNTTPTQILSSLLDTTKDYWLIASNLGLITNYRFGWALDQAPSVTPVGGIVTHGTNFSTASAGGSSWVASASGSKLCFAMPRIRSQPFFAGDPKAVAATGSGLAGGGTPITSTLANASKAVNNKESMYKYLCNQLYYQARPKVTWNNMVVNPPNIPIFPNDPIMIVDNTLSFSTSGTQVVTATVGDMVYEFGERGGTGRSFGSNLHLSIQPIGMAYHY